jgi:putative addiction module component (TIGR02574 family)
MSNVTNIHTQKLELMQLLLNTHDEETLKRIRAVFDQPQQKAFELSEAQKADLDQRTQLRHSGKIKTSPWDEVKARIHNGSK